MVNESKEDEVSKSNFTRKVIEHAVKPENVGTISMPDGFARVTGPCGDTIEISLRVKNSEIESDELVSGCVAIMFGIKEEAE